MKQDPDINKINKPQTYLEHIKNYKDTGTIIRSREKTILEQEKPNKFSTIKKNRNKKLKQQKNSKTRKIVKPK